MSRQALPEDIKIWADETIKQFNENNIRQPERYYIARYKGRHLYLDRLEYGRRNRVARLTYTGKLDEWEFAIFKYSDERYDASEWFFPGSGYVDGTIVGAMKAGLEAYP
jgi:hypothetical protein